MNKLRFLFILIAAAAISLITGCTHNPVGNNPQLNLSGVFKPDGLSARSVKRFTLFEGSLYAATYRGIYVQPLNNTAKSWTLLGLKNKQIFGIAFLSSDSMLVAAVDSSGFGFGDKTLFLTVNQGQSWQPFQNGYGGSKITAYAGGLVTLSRQGGDTLFADGGACCMIARSIDGGRSWNIVFGAPYWGYYGGGIERIYADPYHEGRIISVGSNGFVISFLMISKDYGLTWSKKDLYGSSLCTDVITQPGNLNNMLISFSPSYTDSIRISKSTDDGKTWKGVYNKANISALVQNTQDKRIVYASGLNDSQTLFFAASNNFGDTWQTVTDTTGPTGITTNDLVAATVNGQEVLFFGTNKGVYEYTFSK